LSSDVVEMSLETVEEALSVVEPSALVDAEEEEPPEEVVEAVVPQDPLLELFKSFFTQS
jgi:hypothetical protein